MKSTMNQKILSVLCIALCVWTLSIPCLAAGTDTAKPIIEVRMDNINDARCVMVVDNGKASARVNVTGRQGAEKCKINLKIQKQDGSNWVTVGSWEEETKGRNASMVKSIDTNKGVIYRANVTVTVWLDGKAETKTFSTTGKEAKSFW